MSSLETEIISGVVGVIVSIVSYFAHKWIKNNKAISTVVQDVTPIVQPAIDLVENMANGTKSTVMIHDLQKVLDATTKQAQESAIEALLLQFVSATETSISSLTSTQIGGAVAFVMKSIPPSWKGVVNPQMVNDVLDSLKEKVSSLKNDPGFVSIQAASQYTHTV